MSADIMIKIEYLLTWGRYQVGVAGHGGVEDAEGDPIQDFDHEGEPGVGQERVEEQPGAKCGQHQGHSVRVTQGSGNNQSEASISQQ